MVTQDAASHYEAGIALKKKGDLAGAKSELRRAIELDPKLDAARFYLAEILLKEGEPKAALDQLQATPHSPSVDRLLGLAYLESGDPEHAAEIFRRHLTGAEAHYYLGIALGQQGQLPAGDSRVQNSPSLCSRISARRMKAWEWLCRRQGDAAGALREFQLAARFMPKNAVTLCDLGIAFKDAGKLPEAEQLCVPHSNSNPISSAPATPWALFYA